MTQLTVALPNKNNQLYLANAIKSILNQSCLDFIFLISDNHSSDSSLKIISSFSTSKYILIKPPRELTYAEHLFWLAKQVTTRYVIFFAGDDILHRNCIQMYSQSLRSSESNPALICSPFYSINSAGFVYRRKIWPGSYAGLRNNMHKRFLQGPICNISSVAWNTEKFLRIKYPSELLEDYGNPIDWYCYILLSTDDFILLVNQPLLYYRVHNQSTGNSNVTKHTRSCEKMFNYLIEYRLSKDSEEYHIALHNLSNFRKVIKSNRSSLVRKLLSLRFAIVRFIGILRYSIYNINS